MDAPSHLRAEYVGIFSFDQAPPGLSGAFYAIRRRFCSCILALGRNKTIRTHFQGHYHAEVRNPCMELTTLMRGLTPVPCMSPSITVTLPHTTAKPLGYAAKTGIARNIRRLQSGKAAALRNGPPRKQGVEEFEPAFGMEVLIQSIMQFAQVDD